MRIVSLLILTLFLSSFGHITSDIQLTFEEQKSMRSSFCMYSDGKFYESRPAGCVGQVFASGIWKTTNDTTTLIYQSDTVFKFDIIESPSTNSDYQIVRIIDCYNQLVRFQVICYDTVCLDLGNPGFLKTQKGNTFSYAAPIFDDVIEKKRSKYTNADTLTYKWNCNRESLESINGGSLHIDYDVRKDKVILKNKRVMSVSQQ